jgi:spore maturation protein CgeB
MKRLLHIGCNVGTESLPKYFREQCDYIEFRLDDNLSNNLYNLTYVPDIIFIQIQNDKIGNNNTVAFIGNQIRDLRDRGAFVINWTGDLRNTTPQWMIHFSNNVSVTMFSNMRDVEYCKSIGIPTGFLQQGIDTNIFTPEGEAAQTADIVFLANNYGGQFPLSGYRKDAIKTLQSRLGNRFKVYGNGWGNNSGNVNGSQYEEAKVYRGCKIAISISHYNVDGYFSDRLGRSLCNGAFVLSHNYLGIEKDFKVGEHLDVFNDLNDMVTKCQHYLDNPVERERIALNGQQHASKEYSYQNIVKQILELP